MPESQLFRSKNNYLFPAMSLKTLAELRAKLVTDLGLLPAQICEAASYSFAMIIRYALGLSASGGKTCVLVADNLCGWIAMATLRHLVNANAEAHLVFVLPSDGSASNDMALQLKPLEQMKVPMSCYSSADDNQGLNDLINSSHNVVCGLFDLEQYTQQPERPELFDLIQMLNESHTPVHALEAPLGVDLESGRGLTTPLYASSTLSLGSPIKGLYTGNEFVGRHYVCDISISKDLYGSAGADLSALFAEQPVVQIFPHIAEAEVGTDSEKVS